MLQYKMTFAQRRIWVLITLAILIHGSWQCPSECKCSKQNQRVDCSDRGLTSVPSGLPASAVKLDLSNNSITEVSDGALDVLASLEILDLRRNSIARLGGAAFAKLAKLKTLHLSHNQLQDDADLTSVSALARLQDLYLSANLLTRIPAVASSSLTSLVLDGNRIESATFPDAFQRSPRLASVVLSNNNVGALSSIDFASLGGSAVRSLLLKQNSIASVDPAALSPLAHSLETLNLDANLLDAEQLRQGLSGLAGGGGAPRLLTLSLNANRVGALAADSLAGLADARLRTLQLDENLVGGSARNALAPVAGSLRRLSLRGCGLDAVPFDLAPLKLLAQLAVDDNRLTALPTGLPRGLRTLTAAGNHIAGWPAVALTGVGLEEMDLARNRIATPGADDAPLTAVASDLRRVDLSDNPFHCACELAWLVRWGQREPDRLAGWDEYRCATPADHAAELVKGFDVSQCGDQELPEPHADETKKAHKKKGHKEKGHKEKGHKEKGHKKKGHKKKGHKGHAKGKEEL